MIEAEEGAARPTRLLFLPRAPLLLACRQAAPLALTLGTWGCGGGLPLLHPARALPPGEVRVAAGFSGNVALGPFADSLRRATETAAADPAAAPPAAAPGGSRSAVATAYAEGALVAASIGPGLAPVVAARVGVARDGAGGSYEGGLTYTGRAARADLRRSFGLWPHWALSLGAGGSAILYGRQEESPLPGVDLGRMHGWGIDVPVLIGYESDADLYMVWVGARGGGEHVDLRDTRTGPSAGGPGGASLSLSATRLWGGGLLGLAVGFRHLHVAMELDVSYAALTGDYNAVHAQVRGVTMAPATALWWRF